MLPFPAVYHKPHLLVYLDVITLLPCSDICNNLTSLSTIYNKHAELLGAAVSPSESSDHSIPAFPHVCVSVLFSFPCDPSQVKSLVQGFGHAKLWCLQKEHRSECSSRCTPIFNKESCPNTAEPRQSTGFRERHQASKSHVLSPKGQTLP